MAGATSTIEGIERLEAVLEHLDRMMKAVRETGISDDALAVLIQQSAGTVNGRKIPLKMIWAVLNGVETLKEYVFPTEEK